MSGGSASKLSELLEASSPELEAAVADARHELHELDERARDLDERRQTLVSLITRAQAALGEDGAAYQRQVESLQNLKKAIADIVTAKKRLQLQEEQLKQEADKLDGQAREAMSAGHEDHARATLERKQLAIREAGSIGQQIARLESEQRKLNESEQQQRAEVQHLHSKRTLSSTPSISSITTRDPGEGDVDRQLDQLGAKSAVDDDFARLKAEVQSSAPHSGLVADDAGTADHPESHQPADGDGETAPPR